MDKENHSLLILESNSFSKPLSNTFNNIGYLWKIKVERKNINALSGINFKLNSQYSNKLLPKTFIYDNTPINFSEYLVTDRTCDYIYKNFLDKNIVLKKKIFFVFNFLAGS